MSSIINTRIQSKHDTTENWNKTSGFIPKAGEIIIYDDYEIKTQPVEIQGEVVNETIWIPNIKVGTGNAYVQDLPFVNETVRDILLEHIHNQNIHVTSSDKQFWNNKINIDDAYAQINRKLENETLVFNRF